ncbi:MAG: GYD domain-containing protein [Chloroflexota bacterium]
MPAYIVLGSFTAEGIAQIKENERLRESVEQWVTARGGRVISNYLTLGPYDFVFTCELPSDEVALEGAMLFSRGGKVRTQTLRAFDMRDAEAIAHRLP